ncbi:MAG: hypothetical protein C4519_00695 [Desulfobacteraceae bacterium]|nr:MAG: hypothetical protein C4519_00695 [Desulfobacteraceae bacterium]
MNIRAWQIANTKAAFCLIPAFLFFFGTGAARAGPAEYTWDIGRIVSGQSLYTSLLEKQIPSRAIHHIITGLKAHIDFGRIQPNTAYHFRMDPSGELREFTIESGHDLFHLSMGQERYGLSRWKVPRRIQMDTVRARFEKNLSETIRRAGEADDLTQSLEEILLQDLDPVIELQPGDHFRLVVEKIYGGDWLLRYGEIEAFELRRGEAGVMAIRHGDQYYDGVGRSLKRKFLRVPLHYQFVSSKFMQERKHPILGGVRPHQGIDFAAPLGTPVWAIADGVVITAGWMNGFGLTIILRHAHGYESFYAHLNDFGPEIRPGGTVLQKQVIGYIGTTGLSTGPHLHFGLSCHGEHRDPLKEAFPRDTITQEDELRAFLLKKQMISSILSADGQTGRGRMP